MNNVVRNGPYERQRRLGRKGFGTNKSALDLRFGREVAEMRLHDE